MSRSALWACPGCTEGAFEHVEDYRTHYIAVHTPFFASKRGPTDSLKVREVRIPVPSPTLQTLLGPVAGTQVLAYGCLKCDRWMQTVEGYAKHWVEEHGVAPKSGPAAALQGPEAPAALGIDEAAGVDDNIWGILDGKLQAVPAPRGLIRNDRGMLYGCPGCEDEFKEHAEYRLHWLSLHKRPAVPPQKGPESSSKGTGGSSFAAPFLVGLSSSGEDVLECLAIGCGKVYVGYARGYTAHYRREHGRASPQEGPMDSEKVEGGSPVPAVCEHCGLFYAPWVHDGAQFKRHVLLHVENPEEKKYVGTETLGHLCPFSDACSAFESTRWALALHMKSKHGHDPVYYLLRFKTKVKYGESHAPIPVGDSGHPIPRFCEYCGEPTDNGTTGWLIHREGAHDIREKYTTDPPLPPLGVNPDDLDVALAVFRVLQKSSAMRGNFKRLLAGG